jgi:DNA-binding Lrp family transcriptional regulator
MEKLDGIDLKILEVLQSQGDLTNLKLASIVGLSPSPCLQRVKRLRSAGYIRSFAAILDPAKLGSFIVIYTKIGLSEQTVRQYSIFETAICKIGEVIECSLMSGEFDYFLKVMARDVEHYNRIIRDMMEMDIGIKNFSSFIEIKNVKRSSAIPLGSLLPK